LKPSDFNRLNAIHIAGTKGKGSTSAFISSILTQYPRRKIGLYTSPHLRFVRERICINNVPLSEAKFASYFAEIWDALEASAERLGLPHSPCEKPVYFRYLTLMAFHVFLQEGVDAAVIECGIGGEYDSTNVLERPTVAGVTSLGVDHVAMLGGTVEEIAWHKAGVFKEAVSAFTVEQPEGALRVLRERAGEKGVELRVVRRDPRVEKVKLGLAADFQKVNASLAVAVAAEHLRVMGVADVRAEDELPEEFVKGLEEVKWGGRCETRIQGSVGWCLDGGHTLESIVVAGEWFADCVLGTGATSPPLSTFTPSKSPRILIFNQQTRAGLPLLRDLHSLLTQKLNDPHPFTHVIFCSNVTFSSGYRPDLVSMNVEAKDVEELSVQKESARGWREIDGGGQGCVNGEGSEVFVVRTIENALAKARDIAGEWVGGAGESAETGGEGIVKVLVTGSLHLVGGALEVLEAGEKGEGEGGNR